MATPIPAVPTLSRDKFVKDPNSKLQLLYVYFFASDYSQSLTYYGSISSAKKILEQYMDDVNRVASEFEVALEALLKRYFVDVNVMTTITEDGSNIEFNITCVDQNNHEVTLSDAIQTDGSIVSIHESLVNKYLTH